MNPTDFHCCDICFHQVGSVIFWDFLASELESYPHLVLVMRGRVVHRADSGLRQSWQLPATHFGSHILCLYHRFGESKILLLLLTDGAALCVYCRSDVDPSTSRLCLTPHFSPSCERRSSQPCPPKHIHPSSTLVTSRKASFSFSPRSMGQDHTLWSIPPLSLELLCYRREDHDCKLDKLQHCGAQCGLPTDTHSPSQASFASQTSPRLLQLHSHQ